MRKLAAAALFFAVACASSDDGPAPSTVPPQATADPRVGELQTQLTELLERIDVLNHRLARLEEPGVVQGSTLPPAPARGTPEARTTPVQASPAPPQPRQPALVSAQIAG